MKIKLIVFCCCLYAVAVCSCESSHSQTNVEHARDTSVKHILMPSSRDTGSSAAARKVKDAPTAAGVAAPATKASPPEDNRSTEKDPLHLWPVKTPDLLPGALLPEHRIVAFYGNLFSKKMGILGEYPPYEMLPKLKAEVKRWQEADSSVRVVPALQLIVVTAQGQPGKDGKHRLRMPLSMIDSVLHMAKAVNGLVFLDIQVGMSTVEQEVPGYEKYLEMPEVHLAIDPEFSMKTGHAPGTKIGSFTAADINYCAEYLAKIVRRGHLPPKILVVHRFTQDMVAGYREIRLRPEVQIVMDMDGWGAPALKKDTYRRYIYREPVEYTGFKLFFKNDTRKGNKMMTPREVLDLYPRPLYIQYQ